MLCASDDADVPVSIDGLVVPCGDKGTGTPVCVGADVLVVVLYEWSRTQSSICASRTVVLPLRPFGGSSFPQTGHSSSSAIWGRGAAGNAFDIGEDEEEGEVKREKLLRWPG
jgi:hypothetical protein